MQKQSIERNTVYAFSFTCAAFKPEDLEGFLPEDSEAAMPALSIAAKARAAPDAWDPAKTQSIQTLIATTALLYALRWVHPQTPADSLSMNAHYAHVETGNKH
jgi:hypothetical protein